MRPRHCEPTGRRKAPPDDKLREAIHLSEVQNGLLRRCAPRNDDRKYPYACSISSRSTSSSSHLSSASCNSFCAVVSAAEAVSNFLRSFLYRLGSSRCRCCFAISACSLATVLGSVSSACFSLKLSRRFAALEDAP